MHDVRNHNMERTWEMRLENLIHVRTLHVSCSEHGVRVIEPLVAKKPYAEKIAEAR